MKKYILGIAVVMSTVGGLSAAQAPLTKQQITAAITKTKNNIKSLEDMKKIWANDPDTLEGLNDSIEGQKEQLATLQKQLTTAK